MLRSSVFSSDSQEDFLPAQWKLGFSKKIAVVARRQHRCFFIGDFVHLRFMSISFFAFYFGCLVAGDRSTFRIGAPSLVDSAESDGETATCDRSTRSEESEEREHGEKPPGRAGVCKNRPFVLQNITSNSLSFSLCRFSFRVFPLKKI